MQRSERHRQDALTDTATHPQTHQQHLKQCHRCISITDHTVIEATVEIMLYTDHLKHY